MKIFLKKLTLKNFKGIKEKEIEFTDKTNISGDNATGKSTVFDAYSWLLWGKDSFNRKDYGIKPYDENNEVIHNLESSVEGVFEVDDKPITFKRVYKEVWSKKRGSNDESFTGHTTDFYINDVPKKKKEYEEKISELVTEDEFNLISNPKYFNDILDKKERRKILLSLVDDVSIDDVIATNKGLKDLDLENYTIDELQAMAKSSNKKINDKLKEIPARIDELEATKTSEDFSELEKEKEKVKKAIDELDKKLAGTNNVSEELQAKYDKIADIKKSIARIKSDFEDENKKAYDSLRSEMLELDRVITAANFEIDNTRSRVEDANKNIKYCEDEKEKVAKTINELRKKWHEIKREEFDGDFTCPVCGNDFDPEKKEELIKNFNLDKSRKLESLAEKGGMYKQDLKEIEVGIASYQEDIRKFEDKIKKLSDSKEEKEKSLKSYNKKLEEIKAMELSQASKDEIINLEGQIETIEEEIVSVGQVDNTEVIEQKAAYNEKLEEINSKLSLKGLNAQLEAKIDQYMEDEKKLSREFEENQRILYLCEEYIRAYTELVSEKVNNLFTFVKFKLFDTQINGGVIETAEATYKGVPYGSLNTAAQINAGLDVINSLSKHYDKQIPIFVDNAESVNDLVDTCSQLITLTVSKFKNLRVENL